MRDGIIWVVILSLAALCIIFILACRLVKIKGQLREIENALSEISGGNGNRRLLAKHNDLTAPLSYQINQIVSSYEAQIAAMRRTDEMNKQLMTSLSHDVRTPLTTLIGYLDAVQRGIVSGKEREDYVRIAQRKAHDLKDYIDTLFDWFKLNSNELQFDIRPLEVMELTREILKDWIPIFEEKRIIYDIYIPDVPCVVNLDADAYRRVLNNLIQNVVAHSQAEHIEITLKTDGEKFLLCVSDNGIGISQGDLPHIFDRLYKCDMGRSEKGSGLGLSITKQIVEKLGGSISAESVPKEKTVFTVQFNIN